jgi:hypothetical protein
MASILGSLSFEEREESDAPSSDLLTEKKVKTKQGYGKARMLAAWVCSEDGDEVVRGVDSFKDVEVRSIRKKHETGTQRWYIVRIHCALQGVSMQYHYRNASSCTCIAS